MSTKKHKEHPHLTGEHKYGDLGQLILFFIFIAIWITDSFVFHYSTFLRDDIPDYVRIPLAGAVLIAGWILARGGMKEIFGTKRENPELITTGVFRIVRHPIYTGAISFYLGAAIITLSVASAAFSILITLFYIYISRYEEGILTEVFGEEYENYKKETGRLFPKISRAK